MNRRANYHENLSRKWHRERLGRYTSTFGRQNLFAVGKPKSCDRQMTLLAARSIYCHCEGGLAMNDPDLRKLIRKDLMRFRRVRYSTGWGGNYALNRTIAEITPKGEALLSEKGTPHEQG